jgi:hypothetical protein
MTAVWIGGNLESINNQLLKVAMDLEFPDSAGTRIPSLDGWRGIAILIMLLFAHRWNYPSRESSQLDVRQRPTPRQSFLRSKWLFDNVNHRDCR